VGFGFLYFRNGGFIEMEKISLTKQQSQEIAKVVFVDIKSYILENYERYFIWWLDEVRREKGKAPLKRIGKTERGNCSGWSSL
jgi:hypothetical protein